MQKGAIAEAAIKGNLVQAFLAIGKEEGLMGYWKGNLPQVAHRCRPEPPPPCPHACVHGFARRGPSSSLLLLAPQDPTWAGSACWLWLDGPAGTPVCHPGMLAATCVPFPSPAGHACGALQRSAALLLRGLQEAVPG